MAEFVCNICGTKSTWPGESFEREKPGCTSCGANMRTHALMSALAVPPKAGLNLAESLRRYVAPFGGVDLTIPPRETVRRPPDLRK